MHACLQTSKGPLWADPKRGAGPLRRVRGRVTCSQGPELAYSGAPSYTTPGRGGSGASSASPPLLPSQQPLAADRGRGGYGAEPAPAQDLVACTFKWPAALGGDRVSVVGSFNGWAR